MGYVKMAPKTLANELEMGDIRKDF